MTQPVRIALVQHASPKGENDATLAKAMDMIRDAAGQGAEVVATQELFTSHYFPQTEDEVNFALAQPIPCQTTQQLCELAKELNIELTASLFEKRTQGVYHNTSIMINTAGEIVSKYRKMHIPDDPRFYEKYYFTPGDLGWQSQTLRNVTTGMLICWDQWYPEAARLTALRGAQIIFYPTAIGWWHGETPEDKQQQRDAWQTVQRAHAITNGVFIAAINRIGVEDDLKFWGASFVADPSGNIIAQAGEDEETILIADCDLSLIDSYRQGWPFLRDRRIDAYGDMTRRFVD